MAQLDLLDIVVLVTLLIATTAYFTKGTYWAVPKNPYATSRQNGSAASAKSRDILKRMQESNKDAIVFYGSQTGTAEDYAQRLSKEASSRFGLNAMIADLEEFDFDNLDIFPSDKIAMFVLATYGEGEPTDNALDFVEFIGSEDVSFSEGKTIDEKPLSTLRYVAFGLGNNTYEQYNAVVRNVVKHLDYLGARRIGDVGEGDDGAGTMEEDFLAWKEPMWAKLALEMNLQEREAFYEPSLEITERPDMDATADHVYLGEPNKHHLEGSQKGPFNAQNPFIAPIVLSKELFTVDHRNCLHMEFDVSASNLSYTTGDHIAVWPTNPGPRVKGMDATAKVPFPSPTTYEAVVRYHLEICAPISRQFVATLAEFAPSDAIKSEATKIGQDKDYFTSQIAHKNFNIAQLLEFLGQGQLWSRVPFTAFIEGLHKLQPRYYSISSSSLVQKQRISITAVVESIEVPHAPNIIKGVTTNYLLALKQKQHGDLAPDTHGLDYSIMGPRNRYDGVHVPVHVRHSNFKLPSDSSKPIIMVGPGTGVAPFRAFVQERAHQARNGEVVGKTILFYGCRRADEDFLYKDEWIEYQKDLGDTFDMHVAFSRDGPEKVYVQHLLRDRAEEVNALLLRRAYFYICGDAAHMAREVHAALVQIIVQQRGLDQAKAEEIIKCMRSSNTFQEDVWS